MMAGDAVVELDPGQGMAAGRLVMAARCWRRCRRGAGGAGGGIWYTLNQSIMIHRFRRGAAAAV